MSTEIRQTFSAPRPADRALLRESPISPLEPDTQGDLPHEDRLRAPYGIACLSFALRIRRTLSVRSFLLSGDNPPGTHEPEKESKGDAGGRPAAKKGAREGARMRAVTGEHPWRSLVEAFLPTDAAWSREPIPGAHSTAAPWPFAATGQSQRFRARLPHG